MLQVKLICTLLLATLAAKAQYIPPGSGGGGGAPTGAAGGELTGTFPNPGIVGTLSGKKMADTYTVGTGGVTANLLVGKDTSAPTLAVTPASGGCGFGVALATASASATVSVQWAGVATLVADNTVTAGNMIVGGTTTPGRGRDSGVAGRSTIPSTTCVVGFAQTSATVGGTFTVLLTGPGDYGNQSASVTPIVATFDTVAGTCTVTSGTGSCTASATAGTGSTPGVVITHNYGTPIKWPACETGGSTSSMFGGTTAAAMKVVDVVSTSSNTISTISFPAASASAGVCGISTGGVGPSGTAGAAGATGPTGPTGPSGTNGTNGSAGSTGAAGATGPTGPAGPTGPGGAGSGDVLGPATNTANALPLWNGANTKTLKDGVTAATNAAIPIANGTTWAPAAISGDFTMTNAGVATVDAKLKIKPCIIIMGDPGAASAFLADDNDSPVVCGNSWGSDWTITSVSCYANAGSPTVTPILTAGTGTSILTGALTCGTASWAAGTVNGTPVVHSFSANGATCASTPCTIDGNITSAGGTAKLIVIRIVGTL